MAEKKYYTIEEAAAYLGLTPAEINLRRERNELRGLRDGPNWKFKGEEVEAMARRIRSQAISAAGDEDDTGEVLLSEVALGGSDAGTSGAVIGGKGKSAPDSDLRLVDSDVNLGGSDVKITEAPPKPGSGAKKAAPPSHDLDVTIDEELLLDEDLDESKAAPPAAKKPGGSGVGAAGRKLEDDDLVLGGGSGTGSDVSIGSDSGISLVDPTDSGLSLEEPLELERESEDESLELGEDDMLTFSEEAESEAPTALKADEGFQLTPLEEAGEEDSESGSQVIALEGAPVSQDAPTMIAGAAAPLGAAMLDEDLAGMGAPVGLVPALPAAGGPLGAVQPVFAEGAAVPVPGMVLPEAPYSGLQITGLAVTSVLVILCGWMSYDLLRNMWSWNEPYTVNSALMNLILGIFG